ncbi:sensor histidine kinase [Gorillibacterium sp. sgz5001074]|uniref:sensor histidine kinase n=1 Tax=Gorillibacterium sp. sgz5001074 TaxID=3446695 RepID=UPI003F668800
MTRPKSRDFKFFHIILVFMILTTLLYAVTISSILYGRLNLTLNRQNKEFMQYATSQALNGIENMMKNCEVTARSLYSDGTISSLFLGKYSGNVDYTLFNQFMSINSMFENYTATNNDIKSISIYKLDPELITDGKNIRSIESFKRQDLMQKALDARGKDVWVTTEEEGGETRILLLKYININLPGGVLAIELNQERLNSLYRTGENGNYLFYLWSEGRIAFSSQPNVRIGEDTMDYIERNAYTGQGFSKLKKDSQSYYSYFSKVNQALTVVILYNAYELEREKRAMSKYVILCTCFFVLAGVMLAVLFSKSFALQMEKLMKKIRGIEKGRMRMVPVRTRIREISALDETLCNMALTIDDLSVDIARTERQKVESEIKYLQMQMNPHFLYNSLSAVKWIAYHKKEGQIVRIVDLLSDFYKIVLSQGKDIIPIPSEIQLIEYYVALQNLSHSDQIQLTVRMDPECADLRIGKMTLQPFVENSIIHGKIHGKLLRIQVEIRRRGDGVAVVITDDGMGVKEEFIRYMEALNRGETSDYKVGYGVTNTFMRLKLFDRNARMQVSRGNPGTRVEFTYSV